MLWCGAQPASWWTMSCWILVSPSDGMLAGTASLIPQVWPQKDTETVRNVSPVLQRSIASEGWSRGGTLIWCSMHSLSLSLSWVPPTESHWPWVPPVLYCSRMYLESTGADFISSSRIQTCPSFIQPLTSALHPGTESSVALLLPPWYPLPAPALCLSYSVIQSEPPSLSTQCPPFFHPNHPLRGREHRVMVCLSNLPWWLS